MLEVSIGGIRFESGPADPSACFLISPQGMTGWESGVGVRRDETKRPVAHGAFDQAGYLDPRVVAISGQILARTPSEVRWMAARLAGLLAGGGSGRLSVADDAGVKWCDVRLAATTQISTFGGTETEAEFQVQFWAPDPRKYGSVAVFSGASVQAFHYGNFAATPVVEVAGPVSAPYTVASQGHQVTVTQALTAGQKHRIDMATGWVYLDGVLQTGVTSAVDVFTIPPGEAVSVTGPASMTVRVADTFI